MLKEIIEKYGDFCDSWITEFSFIKGEQVLEKFNNTIEIKIVCANNFKEYKYEIVKLVFLEVEEFIFHEQKNEDKFSINGVLFIQNENNLVCDFNPTDYFDYYLENIDSKFKIKCKSLKYVFISDFYA